ncbi:glycosyltransferase [Candidatus Saccharibacteria bacterium]|nr:glycosyltransferase [Candidatus Saccharibacteria bacterium]
MRKVDVSIIVPMHNEARGLKNFLDGKLLPEIQKLKETTEVILVDDGSSDETYTIASETELMKAVPTKLFSFVKNFGKEAALSAGLEASEGEVVIMIDADGQHPAEAIPLMIEKWRGGARIVTAVSKDKKTEHKFGSRIFYKIMRMLGNKSMIPGAMDFRLLDREVVDEMNKLREHNRIVRGLVDWLGYPQEFIVVKVRKRKDGKPSYSRKKLIALAVDSFVSMSRTPLVFFGFLGVMITILSGILGLFILVQQYILSDPLGLDWAGAVAMGVLTTFLVGLLMISQSVTALYISQIHSEAKGRPLYVIDKRKSKGL